MLALNQIKPVLLTIAILMGYGAHCSRANALETAVVAGGCFWCVEHDFEQVEGVTEVVSGFAGGKVADPTYKQVVRGGTGHREVVQITYDPAVIGYDRLLHMFLRSVDVTDAGGQFCDRGFSYSSAIYATAEQRAIAEAAVAQASADLGRSIVTPVEPAALFYPADDYHQDYAKSSDLVLTRFGPRTKATAYKLYRNACGRDDRVREIWGNAAIFAGS